MRKRLVRALVFVAVALGVAVGVGSAAGALDFNFGETTAVTTGTHWE